MFDYYSKERQVVLSSENISIADELPIDEAIELLTKVKEAHKDKEKLLLLPYGDFVIGWRTMETDEQYAERLEHLKREEDSDYEDYLRLKKKYESV